MPVNMEEEFIKLFSHSKQNNKTSHSIIDVFPNVLNTEVHAILSNSYIFPFLVHQNFSNSVRHQEDSLYNNLSSINNKMRVWRDAFDHP